MLMSVRSSRDILVRFAVHCAVVPVHDWVCRAVRPSVRQFGLLPVLPRFVKAPSVSSTRVAGGSSSCEPSRLIYSKDKKTNPTLL